MGIKWTRADNDTHVAASWGFRRRSLLYHSDESMRVCPVEGAIERAGKAIEQLVDLRGRNDERRADRHDVADEKSHDQALLLRETHGLRSDGGLRIKCALAALVGDKL